MTIEHLDCPACGAAMHLDASKTLLTCPYCGNTEPLDRVTAERLNTQDVKEVELERLKFEREREERLAKERAERAALEEKRRKNKAIRDGVSTVSRKVKRIIIGVVALIFAVGCIGVAFSAYDDAQYEREREARLTSPYEWPTSGLATLIDRPATDKGYISANSVDRFEIEIKVTSVNDFRDYTQSVIDRGFTIDAESSTSRYEAFNDSGNKVSIYYYTSSNQLDIEVYAATPRNTITWPTYGVATSVPAPPSLIGNVERQDSDSYRVHVCDMDANAFNAYVDTCIEAGFNQDVKRSSDYFNADNAEGVSLYITAEGFNTILIRVSKG